MLLPTRNFLIGRLAAGVLCKGVRGRSVFGRGGRGQGSGQGDAGRGGVLLCRGQASELLCWVQGGVAECCHALLVIERAAAVCCPT